MFELSAQVLADEDAKQNFLAAQLQGVPKQVFNCWTNWTVWGFEQRGSMLTVRQMSSGDPPCLCFLHPSEPLARTDLAGYVVFNLAAHGRCGYLPKQADGLRYGRQ